jgi:hypothetical protein
MDRINKIAKLCREGSSDVCLTGRSFFTGKDNIEYKSHLVVVINGSGLHVCLYYWLDPLTDIWKRVPGNGDWSDEKLIELFDIEIDECLTKMEEKKKSFV